MLLHAYDVPTEGFSFTLRLLSSKSPYRSLSEERRFDDAPLRTSERAESPLLCLLMRDSFEEV